MRTVVCPQCQAEWQLRSGFAHISLNRHIAETAMMFFTSVVCAILAYHSTRFVQSEYEYASIAFGSIPVWICESIIPVAFALISFRYLAHTLDKLGWPKKGGNP